MSTEASPFKFHLPDECRLFAPFRNLPPEVRQQIWEQSLTNVGINFVKLQTSDPSWVWAPPAARTPVPGIAKGSQLPSNMEDIASVINMEAGIRRTWHAELAADSRDERADISNYRDVCRQLVILSKTCFESASLTLSLSKRSGVVKLGNGDIVALDSSPDLIYIDYLPPEFYKTSCNLDFKLDCPSLEKIRRVAVRFCHSWEPYTTPKICRSCGKPLQGLEEGHYPAHLYQFLARAMPELEELYLIDYFIIPREEGEDDDAATPSVEERGCGCDTRPSTSPPQVFRAKNRLFHEIVDGKASDVKWKIAAMTRYVRAWLQDRFVRYAKASKMSRHKCPERVRFGILACEWKIPVPATHKGSATASLNGARKKSVSKGSAGFDKSKPTNNISGSRTRLARLPDVRPTVLRFDRSILAKTSKPTPVGVELKTLGNAALGRKETLLAVFGMGGLDSFKFTFRKPFGSRLGLEPPVDGA